MYVLERLLHDDEHINITRRNQQCNTRPAWLNKRVVHGSTVQATNRMDSEPTRIPLIWLCHVHMLTSINNKPLSNQLEILNEL